MYIYIPLYLSPSMFIVHLCIFMYAHILYTNLPTKHLLTKILKSTTLHTSLQTTLTSMTPLSLPTKTTPLPISDSQPLPNTPSLKNTNYSIFSTICILLSLYMTTYLLGFLDSPPHSFHCLSLSLYQSLIPIPFYPSPMENSHHPAKS